MTISTDTQVKPTTAEVVEQISLAQVALFQAVRLLTRMTPLATSLSITKVLDKRAREMDKFKNEITGLSI